MLNDDKVGQRRRDTAQDIYHPSKTSEIDASNTLLNLCMKMSAGGTMAQGKRKFATERTVLLLRVVWVMLNWVLLKCCMTEIHLFHLQAHATCNLELKNANPYFIPSL